MLMLSGICKKEQSSITATYRRYGTASRTRERLSGAFTR